MDTNLVASEKSGPRACARAIAVGALAALAALLPGSATAQQNSWRPDKPVELVVPTAPGGAIDGLARVIQKIIQTHKIVESPVVVLNKPGGGQTIAMTYLDQHANDAHYVLVSTMSVMTNHILGRSKSNYTDYTPIAMLYGEPMTVVVRPDSPIKSARDIQERLRKDPQAMPIGVGIAVGGTNHLAVALVVSAMGVDVKKLKTVVFQANAEAQTALMGGHVAIAPMSVAAALNAARQGRLRIIGVSSAQRGEGELASIPTWREQGLDVAFTNTRFLLAPKGLTAQQTAYWDAVTARIVKTPEWKEQAEKNYWELEYAPSSEAPARLAAIYKQLRVGLTEVGLAK